MLIDVLMPGAVEATQMDDSELYRLEGVFENGNERTTWVAYYLKTSGYMVHRSAHVTLKQVAGLGLQNLL